VKGSLTYVLMIDVDCPNMDTTLKFFIKSLMGSVRTLLFTSLIYSFLYIGSLTLMMRGPVSFKIATIMPKVFMYLVARSPASRISTLK
jgi:hypothetical protein